MEKLMATVLKNNAGAQSFFKTTLKYVLLVWYHLVFRWGWAVTPCCILHCCRFLIDETNPEESVEEALYEEQHTFTYEILSKATGPNRGQPCKARPERMKSRGGCCSACNWPFRCSSRDYSGSFCEHSASNRVSHAFTLVPVLCPRWLPFTAQLTVSQALFPRLHTS